MNWSLNLAFYLEEKSKDYFKLWKDWEKREILTPKQKEFGS